MNKHELEELWSETLRSAAPGEEQFTRLAEGVVDVYSSGDLNFTGLINRRLKRIAKQSGTQHKSGSFDITAARMVIADEVGFANWDALSGFVNNRTDGDRPLLFQYAIAAMERGDFTALETMVGGPERFDAQIAEWYENGLFENEPETLAEIFTASCMLGYDKTAAYLLDKGVDPLAGIKTGLTGFHYAASGGRLAVAKLLIERNVPMEIRNMYDATVLGQALWSAVHEHKSDHAPIIEALIDAGAEVGQGTLTWWKMQDVASAEAKNLVTAALIRNGVE